MPWYRDEGETREEKMERRIRELEKEKKRRDNNDNDTFSMTSSYYKGDD